MIKLNGIPNSSDVKSTKPVNDMHNDVNSMSGRVINDFRKTGRSFSAETDLDSGNDLGRPRNGNVGRLKSKL